MSEENNQRTTVSSTSTSSSSRPSVATPRDVEKSFEKAGASYKPPVNNPKGKYTRVIIIALIICVIAAVIVGVFVATGNDFYDHAAKSGQAPYKTDEEMQAERDRQTQDGKLNISIASLIEFDNSDSEGIAYIENVPSNKYDMKVTITLDSNGETVYQSGAIKPNNYIEKIKLNTKLAAGSYPATATFVAYDNDSSHKEVGQAAAKITIVVNA